jgi:hypothetical protein
MVPFGRNPGHSNSGHVNTSNSVVPIEFTNAISANVWFVAVLPLMPSFLITVNDSDKNGDGVDELPADVRDVLEPGYQYSGEIFGELFSLGLLPKKLGPL